MYNPAGQKIVYEDGNIQIRIHISPENGVMWHTDIKHMTHNEYKHYLTVQQGIEDAMAETGVDMVFCIIESEDNRSRKFATFFGFEPQMDNGEYALFSRNIG